MPTGDISILQKIYDLYKTFYEYSVHFPKKDRFTLGQKCEQHISELLEKVIAASKMKKEYKTAALYQISTQLDMLKILIRLLKDVKVLDLKKYTCLQEQINEIGKMLGGWIKSVQ